MDKNKIEITHLIKLLKSNGYKYDYGHYWWWKQKMKDGPLSVISDSSIVDKPDIVLKFLQ